MNPTTSSRLCSAVLVASLVVPRPAFASPEAETTARALFDEGRRLMDEGKLTEACERFEEGDRVASGIGMKFNLAECYERSGKLASAWAAFLQVAAMARAQGQVEREKVARRRAVALEPDLSKLEVTVDPKGVVEGLEVRRDDVVVGKGQWGVSIPADAGPHVVTATAPGRLPWKTTVQLTGERAKVTVSVPLLDIDPNAKVAPTRAIAFIDPDRGRVQRTVGFALGGAGIVGLLVGAGFGLLAINKQGESSSHCGANNFCDDTGIGLRDDARSSANISTVAFAAGGALLVVGVLAYALAPSARTAPPTNAQAREARR